MPAIIYKKQKNGPNEIVISKVYEEREFYDPFEGQTDGYASMEEMNSSNV